ncbi:MAG: hypothetical protein KY456_04475 [Chloroflexi bacterium]|nr:hypothetical protein [Chloroflexota bacterium]
MPLARLVFVPQHDGRLHRGTIGAIEASHNFTSGGVEADGENGSTPLDERVEASIPASNEEENAA